MSFHYHGLRSTDYHAKVHMQENKEKALKRILLDIVCDKYVAPIDREQLED